MRFEHELTKNLKDIYNLNNFQLQITEKIIGMVKTGKREITIDDFMPSSAINKIEQTLVSVFASDELNLLEIKFKYHCNDKTVELDKNQVASALQNGFFRNPETKHVDYDFSNKIILYFVPSVSFLKSLNID